MQWYGFATQKDSNCNPVAVVQTLGAIDPLLLSNLIKGQAHVLHVTHAPALPRRRGTTIPITSIPARSHSSRTAWLSSMWMRWQDCRFIDQTFQSLLLPSLANLFGRHHSEFEAEPIRYVVLDAQNSTAEKLWMAIWIDQEDHQM